MSSKTREATEEETEALRAYAEDVAVHSDLCAKLMQAQARCAELEYELRQIKEAESFYWSSASVSIDVIHCSAQKLPVGDVIKRGASYVGRYGLKSMYFQTYKTAHEWCERCHLESFGK
jgi:hypothetical protein